MLLPLLSQCYKSVTVRMTVCFLLYLYLISDLYLIGFVFDEVQVVSLEDVNRDMVPMYFDQHSNTLVLNMMKGMSYMPDLGLGPHQ